MKLHHSYFRQNARLIFTLFIFFIGFGNLFGQSVSLPTDRARATIVEIPDYYDPGGKKLKVLRTDSNTPLRGGTAWIWEKQGQEEPESYYKLMSSKGLNAVRMILFDVWENETYTTATESWYVPTDWNNVAYRTRQLARMERAVNFASKYGMYFIINAHNHIPKYDTTYVNNLWKYVAPYFANRTHVLYELANEPMNGIGKNGDMDMGSPANAVKSPRLQALKRTYNIARTAAPNTMLLILTPPGINDYAFGTGLGNLADSFAKLPGTVDWSKTAVAYHLYNNDAAYGAATKAKNLRNLHQRYAGWPSENSFPASVSIYKGDEWRSPSFDNDLYVNQTCEKLGIGWDMWFINGTTQFNANFPVMWADAVAKGWAWTKDVINPQSKITSRGENLPDEGIANINDGKGTTIWLDKSITSWVQFEYETAQTYNTCKITTGIDAQNAVNDPKSWNLQGSNDGTAWTMLDTQTNQTYSARSTVYSYPFVNSTAYKYYRLDITENNGGTSIELGELQFLFVDREAPTVPTGLSFSSSFVLTWKASTDNLGIVNYEIFNNGISLGKTLTNSFTVPGMKPETEYNFTVKAGDPAENWSDFSAKLTTTTGIFTQFEAENASVSGGTIDTNHPGFSGTGFWANVGTVGNYVEFTVNSVSGGSTDITCRYSSGTANKTMTLYVNNTKIRTVTYANTNGWDKWASSVENVTLNAGNNILKYQYDSGNTGYINVDYIQITPNITAISIPETADLLNIYPNPVRDVLYIENAAAKSKIQITDICGNVVLTQMLTENKLNIRQLRTGIYFIRIEHADHQNQTMKIVKL